jgi:ribonuclease HII
MWAGLDEAGRGAWAGPVSAACVVLTPGCLNEPVFKTVNDSKKLSEKRREELFDAIKANVWAYSIVAADSKLVDEVNVLQATMLAMTQALSECQDQVGLIPLALVDGNQWQGKANKATKVRTVVKGDAHSCAIACASILAKVWRDRWMGNLDQLIPGYDFGGHKGYGTPVHQEALARLGPCIQHRVTYEPVKAFQRIHSES